MEGFCWHPDRDDNDVREPLPREPKGRLAGKVAFITGVGGGQGRAAASLFASEGARIVGGDINAAGAEETAAMILAAGGDAQIACPVDLADRQSVDRWIGAGIDRAGGIDILYNNAAAVRHIPFEAMRAEDWDFVRSNALDLVFHATQAAWPHLIARGGGVILNTSSGTASRASRKTGSTALAGAKGGVEAFTRQTAAEGARHGIRACVISPGAIETPGSAALGAAKVKEIGGAIPLGRWGKTEDVAYCALYLASDEASWVTGATFVVDGGYGAMG